MNDYPDSLPDRQLVYQVVASRVGEQGGQALRARIGSKPFLIGSGKSANMLLDNAIILPVQIRVLSSTTGQVLLTNLGDDDQVRMNGEPVPTLVPTYWKPGLNVTVADFELQLLTLVDEEGEGHLERVRPAVITQASEVAPEADPDLNFVIEWGDSRDLAARPPEIPDSSTVLFAKNAPANVDDGDLDAEDTREGWKLESPPPPIVAEPPPPSLPAMPDPPAPVVPPVPRFDESESLPTEAMPLNLKLPQLAASDEDAVAAPTEQTLPKNWQSAGKLSAQLTNDSINLVAGERVRIPVSVRNESASPIQLRVHIAGLPTSWTAALDSLASAALAPGEIKLVDVILETRPPFDQAYLDALLRVHDQLAPDSYLTLPLRLNFKTAPNIVGRLSPTRLSASQTTYLNLQNHTQVTITAFIAGHSDTPNLHVVPSQAQLELPPGQTAELPVNLQALRKPWFWGANHRFSVSVRHSNRAALDYPGVARLRPRVSPRLIALLVILLVAVLAGWRLLGNNAPAVAPPAAASETLLPILVEATEAVTDDAETTAEVRLVASPQKSPTPRPRATATRAASATPRPTATPPPTVTVAVTDILPTLTTPAAQVAPFDDPRPVGCAAALPDGWKPYTVQAGDRVFRLAVTYGTSVEEITLVNCLADPRMLQIGQVLLLPLP